MVILRNIDLSLSRRRDEAISRMIRHVVARKDMQHNAEGRLSDDCIKDNRGQAISDL